MSENFVKRDREGGGNTLKVLGSLKEQAGVSGGLVEDVGEDKFFQEWREAGVNKWDADCETGESGDVFPERRSVRAWREAGVNKWDADCETGESGDVFPERGGGFGEAGTADADEGVHEEDHEDPPTTPTIQNKLRKNHPQFF